jgi:hypothetical protein
MLSATEKSFSAEKDSKQKIAKVCTVLFYRFLDRIEQIIKSPNKIFRAGSLTQMEQAQSLT